ncbi:MAG: putative ABC exporter domain-containing protein [Candidatus Weimeria sp.]
MKLFGYYAFHSFINQVRKLLKSWVIIFILVCGLGGGLIGVMAGSTAEKIQQNQTRQELENPEKSDQEKPTDTIEQMVKSTGLEKQELVCLGMTVAAIIILLYFAGSADKGGKIFLPADVTLLFSSPLRPQSVLIFRLFVQMVLFVILAVYMGFAFLPMISGGGALKPVLIIISWILIFIVAKLIQVLFYLICEEKSVVKKYLRYAVIAVVAALLGAIYAFSKQTGVSAAMAAERILNARGTDWIPVYGWLKGSAVEAVNGNYLYSVICIALSVLLAAGLIFVIYRQKADYYESAIEETAKTAARLEKARESKSGIATESRKKHSEKSRERKGINHGWGASVFFFKAMYSRLNTPAFGIITKTSLTYLAAAVIGGIFIHGQWNVDGTIASILILVMLVFWRSLGNPLGEDTRMGFYTLIPESPWKKLFFSLISGTVNSLLDLIPALIAATVLFRPSAVLFLTGIGFLVTTDLYATLVSTFLDSSIPQSVDKSVRQIVQITFIYFGMLPDIVIIVMGFMKDHLTVALPYCILLNLTIAVIFFAITPLVMEDMRVRPAKPTMDTYTGDLKAARKRISKIGAGMAVIIIVSVLAQLLVNFLVGKFAPGVLSTSWGTWLLAMLPEYLLGFPAGLFLIRKVNAAPPQSRPLGVKNFLAAIPSGVFVIVAGALVGQLVIYLISLAYKGVQTTSAVSTMSSMGPLWIRILFLVILAPLIEEFTFRKTLIDRMRVYGETTAIFFSALAFGLFHGNFSQMFYAFGMGLVFGTIYEKTGRLRYSLILHMATNFLGGIVVPSLVSGLGNVSSLKTSDLPVGLIIYVVAYYGLAMAGFVVFTIRCVRTRFYTQPLELPRGRVARTVYGNAGMLIFFAAIAAVVVMQTV